MIVKIYGFGCSACQKLYHLVKETMAELKLETDPEYITDVQEIMNKDFRSFPVLVINNKVVLTGKIPDKSSLKEIILKNV